MRTTYPFFDASAKRSPSLSLVPSPVD